MSIPFEYHRLKTDLRKIVWHLVLPFSVESQQNVKRVDMGLFY